MNVVAGVIRKQDKLLLALRPSHKHHGDLWEFPGGKVASGETNSVAICREIREELGLSVDAIEGELAKLVEGGLSITFIEVKVSGEVHLFEHQALAWCNREEALNLALCPLDRRFMLEVL